MNSGRKANAFFDRQGGVNPTPFIMGYKAAAKAEYLRSRKEVGAQFEDQGSLANKAVTAYRDTLRAKVKVAIVEIDKELEQRERIGHKSPMREGRKNACEWFLSLLDQ